MGAERNVAWNRRLREANMGFEPLTIAVDETYGGDGALRAFTCHGTELIKDIRGGWCVQKMQGFQGVDAFTLVRELRWTWPRIVPAPIERICVRFALLDGTFVLVDGTFVINHVLVTM
jgi:hypothetical protein